MGSFQPLMFLLSAFSFDSGTASLKRNLMCASLWCMIPNWPRPWGLTRRTYLPLPTQACAMYPMKKVSLPCCTCYKKVLTNNHILHVLLISSILSGKSQIVQNLLCWTLVRKLHLTNSFINRKVTDLTCKHVQLARTGLEVSGRELILIDWRCQLNTFYHCCLFFINSLLYP